MQLRLASLLFALVHFLIIMLVVDCSSASSELDEPQPSTSSVLPGHARLRMRAHRRRHRLKNTNHVEIDELFEMLGKDLKHENARHHPPRSAKASKERNEELCVVERTTIELNTEREEFDPPFLVEVRCRNTAEYEQGVTSTLKEQTCVHDLLRCVQRYDEVHVSKRPHGAAHWSPHTLHNVPVSCDCMWPVDKYGHQEL